MDFPYYPINDFGPLMKGMVIGGIAITHVFLAQFAIGGGLLLCYFQWIAMRKGDLLARQFVDGYFRWLVLISFVLGALTGVSLWFTTIQISPRTIGLMVDEFHWLWATEWTFFCTEVAAGYLFYRYGQRLDDRTRLTLLVLYSIAAWMSLFWINGILSWQLTPGDWLREPSVWNAFFNPTFWPSLVFRTISAMAEAGLFATAVINFGAIWSREEKTELLHRALVFLTPMIAMPVLGVWFLANVPDDSREWALGGSPAMTMFLMVGAGASLLIGLYAAAIRFNRRNFISGSTAMLLLALAFAATAGGEFVREGIRKPYTVRHRLYANSIHEDDVREMRRFGCTSRDPYPLVDAADYPTEQLRTGVKTFRLLCSVCHTKDGANGLLPLVRTWGLDQQRLMFAKLQHTKPFMPPFAGTAEELESLVQWLRWEKEGRPEAWPESRDEIVLAQIQSHLDDAGTRPGIETPDASRP
jgi:mono/diheme cytochrome c family protein